MGSQALNHAGIKDDKYLFLEVSWVLIVDMQGRERMGGVVGMD